MFILCTFADGPYWPSSLEPLLYPTGCSFYRPFSYLESYLAPVLLDIFKDESQLKTFLADKNRNDGIFGIRFRNESDAQYRGKFIPLRRVKLTNVRVKDTVQLRFRLDQYVQLSAQEKFNAIELDGIIDYKQAENMLMVEIPSSKMELFQYSDEPPNKLWSRLAKDDSISPSARQNFAGTLVLRLFKVTERGHTASIVPELLDVEAEGSLFGYPLRCGTVYDFDLAYNKIFGPSESEDPIKHDFILRSPAEHLAVSRDRLSITGPYRRESIWIQPKVGQPASVFLEWVGVNKAEKDALADPISDKILPLRIPVKSVAAFWSTERILDAIFALVFLVAALASFYFAMEPGVITQPAPSVQRGQEDIIAKILLAVGAACAGLFGSFLKDFIKGRK